jgi:type II secretory pathway pseudopilin PulG
MKKIISQKNQTGFSIIEIIITIFIITIIGIAIANFQSDIFSLNKINSDNLLDQESIQKALKIIGSEIRSASPSAFGSYPLSQTSTSSITFYSDIDNDDLTEKIRYFLEGSILKKGVIKPVDDKTYSSDKEVVKDFILNISSATTSIFNYYDKTNTLLETPTDTSLVKLIKINIITDHDPLKLPSPLSMSTQIFIRSLKDNL